MIWILLTPVTIYIFLLLQIYRNLFSIKSFKPDSEHTVRISVIVACKNEEEDLPSLLNDLSLQNYPAELFEVIIVDDESSDSTSEKAIAFRSINRFKVLRNNGRGKKQAIRTGIETADCELVVTTDADCRVGPWWLNTIASYYSIYRPEMIICPVTLNGGEGFFNRFQELEFLSLQGITAGTAAGNNPVMCNGANLVFRREAYMKNTEELHFEKPSGDDIFLLQSLKKEKGTKIDWLSSPEVSVTAGSANSLSSFLKQRIRWISKAGAYNDGYIIVLSIVTFVTILVSVILLILSFSDPAYLPIWLIAGILKTLPDYLILSKVTRDYNKRYLMKWFLPSRIIYPFYVLIVVIGSLFFGNHWK